MPKNIVILLDGTSNEIERDRTNILRLYGVLAKDAEQLVYYDPGVGVNGGRILGQRGGVKAGHSWRGGVVCKKAPDRGPFCKSASALGDQAWVTSLVSGSTAEGWFLSAPAWVAAARRRPADSLRR